MKICVSCSEKYPEPSQERSRKTWHLILDSAASLFMKEGYDEVNTNSIASEAGVSIGSLYRYFPDKQTILASLVERESKGLRESFSRFFSGGHEGMSLEEIVGELLDSLLLPSVSNHPDICLRMLQGAAASRDLEAATRELDKETLAALTMLFETVVPGLDSGRARRSALVCKTVVESLLVCIGKTDDSGEKKAIADELRRLVISYIKSL